MLPRWVSDLLVGSRVLESCNVGLTALAAHLEGWDLHGLSLIAANSPHGDTSSEVFLMMVRWTIISRIHGILGTLGDILV